MGTTAGGLPYPEPTDPVANGATAIRTLAESVDARTLAATAYDFLHYTPTGPIDSGTTTGSWLTWLTIPGGLTLPAWASRAYVTANLHGIYDATAFGNIVFVRLKIGTAAGNAAQMPGASISMRYNSTWVDRFGGMTPGAKALTVETLKTGGTGSCRADVNSTFQILVQYAP